MNNKSNLVVKLVVKLLLNKALGDKERGWTAIRDGLHLIHDNTEARRRIELRGQFILIQQELRPPGSPHSRQFRPFHESVKH